MTEPQRHLGSWGRSDSRVAVSSDALDEWEFIEEYEDITESVVREMRSTGYWASLRRP